VQLNDIQLRRVDRARNFIWRCVNKNTYFQDFSRKPRRPRRDIPGRYKAL